VRGFPPRNSTNPAIQKLRGFLSRVLVFLYFFTFLFLLFPFQSKAVVIYPSKHYRPVFQSYYLLHLLFLFSSQTSSEFYYFFRGSSSTAGVAVVAAVHPARQTGPTALPRVMYRFKAPDSRVAGTSHAFSVGFINAFPVQYFRAGVVPRVTGAEDCLVHGTGNVRSGRPPASLLSGSQVFRA
jgi:hypothetical protein